jgi:hypothetical protein
MSAGSESPIHAALPDPAITCSPSAPPGTLWVARCPEPGKAADNHQPALTPPRLPKSLLLPEVVQLALEGYSNQAIGKKLHVPRQTVDRWLREQRQEWAETGKEKAADLLQVTVARLESAYRQAMDGWRRSLAEKQTFVDQSGSDENAVAGRLLRKETQSGKAALLGKAIQAAKEICAFKLKHFEVVRHDEEAAHQAQGRAEAAARQAEQEQRFKPHRALAAELAGLSNKEFRAVTADISGVLTLDGQIPPSRGLDELTEAVCRLPVDDYRTLREMMRNEYELDIPKR